MIFKTTEFLFNFVLKERLHMRKKHILVHCAHKSSPDLVKKIQERQGTKIFQYSTCPRGRVTYNFYWSCKHMHLSFKCICNIKHKGVICNMTSFSNSSQSTRPTGRVLREELLVLSRFHS